METDIWAEEGISNLLHAFLALETEQEAQVFLRDLFTAKELREFGRRWQAARMLKDRVPYVQIEKETGLSSTTIARISKWLNDGAGGYKMMFRKLRDGREVSIPQAQPVSEIAKNITKMGAENIPGRILGEFSKYITRQSPTQVSKG